MDADQQIRSAVANINDELHRILALTDVRNLDSNNEQFRSSLIKEFNKKLRELKDKVRDLTAENKQLKKKIAVYEQNSPTKARPTKSEGAIPNLQYVSPKRKKQKTGQDDEQVLILSSPVKGPSQNSGNNITSSQFNRLPTQYSDSESPNKNSSPTKKVTKEAPKVLFAEENDRVVADSEDEFETLDEKVGVPSHYTSLQRVGFLRKYYRMRLDDRKFNVELSKNPITEKPWAQDDFRPNGQWQRPKTGEPRVMTKAQEKNLQNFFIQAGSGAKSNGPVWDSDVKSQEELSRSQIMDKYSSPPGFMVGSFPTTQEQEERKAEVKRKEEERIRRRLASALARPPGEFLFYEDVLNQYVARGQYTTKKG
ncbi:uncharacterized protein CXQ87_005273 [Candidozyma duobushaemuli]|uniref:DNA endonuclease activator Ctp1 C-terminal domain-containing protein n=2 Tax=Candidozyma TaxID=3303203 RepID=A0ABX8IB61_9ASCO|nr:uncharacterized protein CXQ87_005273 [[Candida] duobushaemulonis]PVH14994.1 hypothetical protein CXQ87_005273 [[Candida] duobushaemulonis]QWU89935.1 hypothetical protein CA3LBN_004293 [[Candida] haemuloni]